MSKEIKISVAPMPKPAAVNENRKGLGRIIEIDESALELNIEQAADDLVEMMLRRNQTAKAKKAAGETPFTGTNRQVAMAGPFSDLIEMAGLQPINPVEIKALNSLVAYASFNQNMKEENIKEVVKAEFGVDRIEKIQRIDYQRAFDFLLNLRMDRLN